MDMISIKFLVIDDINIMDKYEMMLTKFLVINDMSMLDKYEMSMKDQAALKQGSSKTLQGKAPLERSNITTGNLPGNPWINITWININRHLCRGF